MKPAIRWFFILSFISGTIVELFEVESTGINAVLVILPVLICLYQYGLAKVRFGLDVLLMAALTLVATIIYFMYGMNTSAGQGRLFAYVFFLLYYCFSQLSLLHANALDSVCRITFFFTCLYMLMVDILRSSEFVSGVVSPAFRFYGFGNPNLHGILAVVGLMTSVYLGYQKTGVPRFVRGLLLTLLWLNLWAPKSRAAWITLALFSFLFALLQPARYKKPALVFLLVIAPIGYLMRPSADSLTQTAGGLRLDSDSVSERSDVTFEAIDMAVRVGYRPFGLGSVPALKELTSMNAIDNAYICMMLETGFWGLGVFLAFVIATTQRGLRTCLGSDHQALRHHRWAFAVFVALAVHSLYESFIMSGLQMGTLMFLFCGALLNRPVASEAPLPIFQTRPRRFFFRDVLIAYRERTAI